MLNTLFPSSVFQIIENYQIADSEKGNKEKCYCSRAYGSDNK